MSPTSLLVKSFGTGCSRQVLPEVYSRQNIQTYILVPSGEMWLVEQNMYPPPRGFAALCCGLGGA
jgi:hypothetical protein